MDTEGEPPCEAPRPEEACEGKPPCKAPRPEEACEGKPPGKAPRPEEACEGKPPCKAPRLEPTLGSSLQLSASGSISWKKISAESLDVDYCRLFGKGLADRMLRELERSVTYYTGDLARVRVFGKWHDIPRQQCAFGDAGLKYTFSGRTVPATPWTPLLTLLKEAVEKAAGTNFNFVLLNRYRSGSDHIGEHRDDEAELDPWAPIASVSLGQQRDFVFRHRDSRGRRPHKRDIPTVRLTLEHGSLLLMNPPTNRVWYHSLPARKSCPGVRVNLTFRRITRCWKAAGCVPPHSPHRINRETRLLTGICQWNAAHLSIPNFKLFQVTPFGASAPLIFDCKLP